MVISKSGRGGIQAIAAFDKDFYVIPSVRRLKSLDLALQMQSPYVLLPNVHIGNLRAFSDLIHKAEKRMMVNADLVRGLSQDKDGIRFLSQMFKVDVVIVANTMRTAILREAGVYTIHRIALIDSLSLDNSLRTVADTTCDAVEIRPAFYGMEYIEKFRQVKDIPYFIAGFIDTAKMIDDARALGFKGITTSKESLWSYRL